MNGLAKRIEKLEVDAGARGILVVQMDRDDPVTYEGLWRDLHDHTRTYSQAELDQLAADGWQVIQIAIRRVHTRAEAEAGWP